MSTRDDDILDFDFFDEEDATVVGGARGRRGPASDRRARSPRRVALGFGPPRNLTPLLRLIGLIALAILIVVLLVVWVEGCTADAQARPQQHVPRRDRRDRERVRAARPAAEHAPDDARA